MIRHNGNKLETDDGSYIIINEQTVALEPLKAVDLEVTTVEINGGNINAMSAITVTDLEVDGYLTVSGANGNCGYVTLGANVASTDVANTSVTANSRIVFFPTSANAAANFADGAMYVSAKDPGVDFTITHTNDAHADKTFDYIIFN